MTKQSNSFNPNLINLLHNPASLRKRHYYFLIMRYVFKAKLAAFAVFDPFLRGLVTSDIKFPCGGEYIFYTGMQRKRRPPQMEVLILMSLILLFNW